MTLQLKFSGPKAYYKERVFEFNLPAGHTCPQASACLVKADRHTGQMTNGPKQEFRCYAAMNERFPSVRDIRWNNFDAIKNSKNLALDISSAIPKNAKHIRIHGSGDFFNQKYFDAWIKVAKMHPDILFWAFTKSVELWIKRTEEIPKNLILQASRGGKQDLLIDKNNLKSATVFPTIAEAMASGLPIDTDDSFAMTNKGSFALVDNFGPDRGGRKSEIE